MMVGRLPSPPRVLIIGLDGGSLDVIEPLIDQGRLPALASLLRSSAYGPTETTWPAHTAPGWTTFVTASLPGGHGIFQFFDTQHPAYGARVMSSTDVGRSNVWDWLAKQGLSVGLINVPMSHPPSAVPGYQLTWPLTRTLRFARPPDLVGRLARDGARFRPDIAVMFQGDHGYLVTALSNVRERARTCAYMMEREPTDVTMVVLTEPDRVCHHYWHFADPGHPGHRPPKQAEWADAIGMVYEAIDDVVGELVELVGPDTTVLIVSDHGSGPGHRSLALNRLLADAGLLATTTDSGGGDALAGWFQGRFGRIDFARTAAYSPVPGSYGVNVNFKGRQRRGTVAAADKLVDELIDLLLDVDTPEGAPAFRSVLPAEAAYPGSHIGSAPDLLLIPADEATMVTPDFEGPLWRLSDQTGLHRHAGMWSYRSAGVRTGRRTEAVRLIDLVPSVLTGLGLTWPDSVHGTPIAGLPGADGPVRTYPEGPSAASAGGDGTLDSSVGDALRAMGYL